MSSSGYQWSSGSSPLNLIYLPFAYWRTSPCTDDLEHCFAKCRTDSDAARVVPQTLLGSTIGKP